MCIRDRCYDAFRLTDQLCSYALINLPGYRLLKADSGLAGCTTACGSSEPQSVPSRSLQTALWTHARLRSEHQYSASSESYASSSQGAGLPLNNRGCSSWPVLWHSTLTQARYTCFFFPLFSGLAPCLAIQPGSFVNRCFREVAPLGFGNLLR